MAYPAKTVANYFIEIARSKEQGLDHLKLQKLIYFAHGWYLALTDEPLIEEGIDAWKYGPVIKDVYHEFKHFGASNITEYAKDILRDMAIPKIDEYCKNKEKLEKTKEILDAIWDAYAKYSGLDLSALSHKEGTPWEQTYKRNSLSTRIDDDVIKEFFHKLNDTA